MTKNASYNVTFATSVTRFGEISPIWKRYNFLWQFLEGIQRNPLLNLAKNYAIGLIFIVVNDQNIENIVASGHTVRDCI